MSAKSCQYCGKPLSKIRIGDGEFCSREHRNQYRMRRGMDRLLEANQVASLLRRRETPKPISPERPPAEAEPRLGEEKIRFSPSPEEMAVPSTRWAPSVTLPQAQGPIGWRPKLPASQPKPFEMLRQTATRVVPGRGRPSIPPAGSDYLNRAKRPKMISHGAREGALLRVSMASGFRLPQLRSQSLHAPDPSPAAFLWPSRMLPQSGRSFGLSSDAKALTTPFPKHTMELPTHKQVVLRWALKPVGAIRGKNRALGGNGLPAIRVWGPVWPQKDGVPVPTPHYGKPQKATPGLTVLPPRVIGGYDDPRLALVPLTPQDGRSPYAPVITIAVEKSPRVVPQEVIVESFDAGLSNWVGGTEDWTVDAAGVRTGSLALLMSSLDMHDYDVEFLTRIENRSVTCVFRAAGDDQYYAATIAANPRGGLEFTRRTVMAEVSDAPVIMPLNISLAKTAFNVRLRALGNSFCIWVNGQKIADWTDSRLGAGGVGFLGTPKDRARIYWVKLSPVGEPGKES